MSITKRFMELEEDSRSLVSALETLIKYGEIVNEASLGIAKKIIHDRSIDKLSLKQKEVFTKFIEPLLMPACEKYDCCATINISDLPEAYCNRNDFGGLFCEECQYIEFKIQRLSEKDND